MLRRAIRFMAAFTLSFPFILLITAESSAQTQDTKDTLALEFRASSGDAVGQYRLACYLFGNTDGPPDYERIVTLLASSSEQHYAPAEFVLAYLYEHGRGVKKNFVKAAELYRLAAQQSYAPAENNLGSMYEHGEGVEWYQASAEHGNMVANWPAVITAGKARHRIIEKR